MTIHNKRGTILCQDFALSTTRVRSPIEVIHGSHCLPSFDSGKGIETDCFASRESWKTSCVMESKVPCWFTRSTRIRAHTAMTAWIYLYCSDRINGHILKGVKGRNAPLANTQNLCSFQYQFVEEKKKLIPRARYRYQLIYGTRYIERSITLPAMHSSYIIAQYSAIYFISPPSQYSQTYLMC